MRRYLVIAVTAAALLASGCSGSPGAGNAPAGESNDGGGKAISQEAALLDAQEADAEETANSEEIADSETGEQTSAAEETAPADSTAEEPAKNDAEKPAESESAEKPRPEEDKKTEDKPAVKKQPKAEQKVQEAKKSNEQVNKAVSDSIMDNAKDKNNADNPASDALKKQIESIRSQVKDLKQHTENNDAEQMKTISGQIAATWEAMKADVKSAAPDMIKFLDEKMAALSELKDADAIDQTAMLQLNYELYQSFRQLADKAGV